MVCLRKHKHLLYKRIRQNITNSVIANDIQDQSRTMTEKIQSAERNERNCQDQEIKFRSGGKPCIIFNFQSSWWYRENLSFMIVGNINLFKTFTKDSAWVVRNECHTLFKDTSIEHVSQQQKWHSAWGTDFFSTSSAQQTHILAL